MAMNVHMTVEGVSQGLISESCCPVEGRENTSIVMKLEQSIEIPWNVQDGRAQGLRIHRPLRVVKAIDRASPLLATAITTNELLKVRFDFYRYNPDGDGKEELYYTIEIEKANIITFRGELPFTLDSEASRHPALETIEFAFEKIKTTFTRDGREFTDNFRVRAV